MAELSGVLAFGTLWFWLLAAAVNIALLCTVEFGRGGRRAPTISTLLVVATMVLFWWLGDFSPAFLWDNRWYLLPLISGYFVAGAGWGIAKWWFYAWGERHRYDDFRERFCEDYKLDPEKPIQPIGAEGALDYHAKQDGCRTWQDLFLWKLRQDGIDVNPEAKNHKGDLFLWIAFWPWSALWTLTHDPVEHVVRRIYQSILGVLHRISLRAFAGTESDLPPEK